MTLSEILNHFEKAERCGSGYHALCPAHADKKQSLSIGTGDGGRILLNCFAGCSVNDICNAAGLKVSDLFADDLKQSTPSSKPVVTAEYIYKDYSGKPVFKKVRRSDKSFFWEHFDGGKWIKGRVGKSAPLYRQYECRDQKYLYLVEGEKDCDNLLVQKLPAISPPDGAKTKWRDEYTEFFEGKRVCIIQDNDKPGKEFAQAAAQKLSGTAEIVKILDLSKVWADIPEHGDVSDMMTAMPNWKDKLSQLAKDEHEYQITAQEGAVSSSNSPSRDLQESVERAARETNVKLRSELFTEIMADARAQGVESTAALFADRICKAEYLPDLWELPKPFDRAVNLPKLTEHCLPPKLWEYLQAVSKYVQVAPEMGVLPMLSVLSLCVQGKAAIAYPANAHTEPLNIYTMTIAAPGERKSGCFKEFISPVNEYQREKNNSLKHAIEQYRTRKAFLECQRDKAIKSKDAKLEKAQDITKELSQLEEVHELRLMIEDITPEALAAELASQGERIGILDDEGTVFDVLAGIYSNGQVNLNIFLKAYDGSSYMVSRKMGGSCFLQNPLLTMGLMTQPAHFTEAMNNKQFSGRGFIHRFMFSYPDSMTGRLNFHSPNIDPTLRKMYHDLVTSLLVLPYPKDKVPVIYHSDDAVKLFQDYFGHLQWEMRQEGKFGNMKEWASKQFARALRVAGIFHMAENKGLIDKPLSGQNALYAIALSLWEEEQAMAALSGECTDSEAVRNAKLILEKLKAAKVEEITKGELLSKKITRLNSTELQEPLELLTDLNYIKTAEVRQKGSGRPKITIKINPNIIS